MAKGLLLLPLAAAPSTRWNNFNALSFQITVMPMSERAKNRCVYAFELKEFDNKAAYEEAIVRSALGELVLFGWL